MDRRQAQSEPTDIVDVRVSVIDISREHHERVRCRVLIRLCPLNPALEQPSIECWVYIDDAASMTLAEIEVAAVNSARSNISEVLKLSVDGLVQKMRAEQGEEDAMTDEGRGFQRIGD